MIVTSKKEYHSVIICLKMCFKLLCLQVTVTHAVNLNPEWSHVSSLGFAWVCDGTNSLAF